MLFDGQCGKKMLNFDLFATNQSISEKSAIEKPFKIRDREGGVKNPIFFNHIICGKFQVLALVILERSISFLHKSIK